MTDHPAVTAVDTIAPELLTQARAHAARRAAKTLVSGTSQRATLIALAEGAGMADHDAPTAATLYVVSGTVELHTHDKKWLLNKADLAVMPPQRHGLTAITDAVVLLTVALR